MPAEKYNIVKRGRVRYEITLRRASAACAGGKSNDGGFGAGEQEGGGRSTGHHLLMEAMAGDGAQEGPGGQEAGQQ